MALTGDEDTPKKKVVLPKALHDLEKVAVLPKKQDRWNTNEEIASWLTQFDNHSQWLTSAAKIRPESGSLFLYNRKSVNYKIDGYLWKKRKDCKTTREDHMKLKIKGVDCLYGNYVHSAIIPTFHRRCYWLLQNPDMILVHYLNVPATEDRKLTLESLTNGSLIDLPQRDDNPWSAEELVKQITPMLYGYQIQLNGSKELSPADSADIIAQYLVQRQGPSSSISDSRDCNCLDCATLRVMAQVPQSPAGHNHSVASTCKKRLSHHQDKSQTCSNQNTLSKAVANKVKMDDSGNINLLIVVANQNNAGSKLQVKSMTPVDSSQNISEVLRGLSNVQCLNGDHSAGGTGTSEVVPNRHVGAGHARDLQGLGHSSMAPSPATHAGHTTTNRLLQSNSHGSFDSMDHSPSSQNSQASPGMLQSQSVDHGSQGQHSHSLFQHVRYMDSANHHVAQSSPQRFTGRNFIRPPQLVLAPQQSVQNQAPHHPVIFSAAGQQCNLTAQAQEPSPSIHMNNVNNSSVDPSLEHSSNPFTKSVQQPGTFRMPGFRLPNDDRTHNSVGSPQLILQPAPANSTKPVQFILKASEAKAGEAPKFILKPAQGSEGLVPQGIASPQFILKAVSSGDVPASPMPTASPQQPISATVASKPAAYAGMQHVSQPMQNVHNMNPVAAEARRLSQGIHPGGSAENHSNPGQANVSWAAPSAIPASSQTNTGGPSGQQNITCQESQALREMVNGDPNLKTLENRFKDHRSNLVMLPERVQEHYLHNQAASMMSKNGQSPVPQGYGQTSEDPNTPVSVVHVDTPVSMTGVESQQPTPTQSSCETDLPQRTSPGRVDLTYQHSVNSSHSYCQSDTSDFPTLSEFNSVDQHGNFTSHDRSSLLSEFLSANASSFQDSSTQPDSGHIFSKSINTNSDLGSLPSPSNIELDFDSFDLMASPLPELGASLLATSSPQSSLGGFGQEEPHPGPSTEQNNSSQSGQESQGAERQLCDITDFSPDWSYTEGGVKVLVTGPWQSTEGVYNCVFDQTSVVATLTQNGVLRCYSPAHEAGKCALQVTCNGVLVSKATMFDYRARGNQTVAGTHDWLSLDENRFKMAILERLEQMEQRLGIKSQGRTDQSSNASQHKSFEDRVVSLCQDMMVPRAPGAPQTPGVHRPQRPHQGMTLLHLAAALGFNRLISTLFSWRRDHNSLVTELELDPMSIDDASCTPLMWACALGHVESALLLYRWHPPCLKMSDSLGRFPLDVAKSRGHTPLANALAQISLEDPQTWTPIGVSPPPSNPIQIPTSSRNHHNVPAFMVSSPATNTPSSSLSDDSAPLFDGHSPSSGGLSNLSASPSSRGFATSSAGVSPQLSPCLQDAPQRSGADGKLSIQQGFLRRDSSSSSGKSTSPHQFSTLPALNPFNPRPGGSSSPMPLPPPVSPSTLRAFLNGSQILEGLDPAQLLGHAPGGEREQADTKEMWESFVRELQVAAQQQQQQQGEQHVAGGDDGLDQRCDSPMQTDDYASLMAPRQLASNKEQYLSLAEQILDALPDRIKLEGARGGAGPMPQGDGEGSMMGPQGDQEGGLQDNISSAASSFSSPGGLEDILYRQGIDSSPGSSYSGHESASCHTSSPSNVSFDEDSPPADWGEFLQGSSHALQWAFSILTLSDQEQRQLYKAALVIQNAFRQYKGRQQQKQQELEAAVIIQSYYRRYKEYFHYKSMSEAARVIQNKFRSFQSYRHFQRSRKAAIVIQNSYRTYRAQEQFRKSRDAAILIQQRFRDKRKARMKKEQEAARKIQRFLRRYHNRVKSLKRVHGNWMPEAPP